MAKLVVWTTDNCSGCKKLKNWVETSSDVEPLIGEVAWGNHTVFFIDYTRWTGDKPKIKSAPTMFLGEEKYMGFDEIRIVLNMVKNSRLDWINKNEGEEK